MNGVGAYQQFIQASGGGGAVTAAENGLYLDGTTVKLGTNPLIEPTTISGNNAFDLFLQDLPIFVLEYLNQATIQSASSNYSRVMLNDQFSEVATDGADIHQHDFEPNLHQHAFTSGSNLWFMRSDAFGYTFNGVDGLGNGGNEGLGPTAYGRTLSDGTGAFSNVDQQATILQKTLQDALGNTTTRQDFSAGFSEIITDGASNYLHNAGLLIDSLSLSDASGNSLDFAHFLTGQQLFINDVGLGRSLQRDYSVNDETLEFLGQPVGTSRRIFDAQNRAYEIQLGDTKRGFYMPLFGGSDFIWEYFPATSTDSSRQRITSQSSSLEYSTGAGNINSLVQTTGFESSISSSVGGIGNEISVGGGAGAFGLVDTQSNLGLREANDYSANYIGLSYTNKDYQDTHLQGADIVGAPAVGEVLEWNGANWIPAPNAGGGGGGGLELASSYNVASIDAGQASANNVQYIKFLCPADIDVTQLGTFITSTGGDTFSLGIYDLANNLLVQATVSGGAGTGFQQSAAFPAVSLTGGTAYWLAIKGTIGSANYGSQTCFNDPDIAQSQFFGGAGLPNPKAGFSTGTAPFITINA